MGISAPPNVPRVYNKTYLEALKQDAIRKGIATKEQLDSLESEYGMDAMILGMKRCETYSQVVSGVRYASCWV